MDYLFDVIKAEKRIPALEELRAKVAWRYAGKELYWLQSIDAVKDSVAWYIKQLSLFYLNRGSPQGIDYLKQHCLERDDVAYLPFDLFYSFVQTGKIKEDKVFRMLRVLTKHTYRYAKLHKDEWLMIAQMPHLSVEVLQTMISVFATNGQLCVFPRYGLFEKCSPEFLRKKFNHIQVIELLRDTNNVGTHAIVSMNHLQELHDEQATAARRAARLADVAHYFYDNKFIEVVERFGWHLPVAAAELVERGEEHHNCVASYRKKHIMLLEEAGGLRSRLLLRADATAEIQVAMRDGKLSVCNQIQCKGMHNANQLFGNWPDFREAIMGLPPEALNIEVKEKLEL
jgi:hypothetical protein